MMTGLFMSQNRLLRTLRRAGATTPEAAVPEDALSWPERFAVTSFRGHAVVRTPDGGVYMDPAQAAALLKRRRMAIGVAVALLILGTALALIT